MAKTNSRMSVYEDEMQDSAPEAPMEVLATVTKTVEVAVIGKGDSTFSAMEIAMQSIGGDVNDVLRIHAERAGENNPLEFYQDYQIALSDPKLGDLELTVTVDSRLKGLR